MNFPIYLQIASYFDASKTDKKSPCFTFSKRLSTNPP